MVIDHELTDYKGLINRFFIMRDGQLSEADVTTLPEKAPIPLLTSGQASRESAFTLENIAIKQGDKTLLHQEKFTFQKGVSTLTGDNGAGKSTLLKAMAQLHPYKGEMRFQDRRLSRFWGKKSLYESLTLAVQDAAQQFVTLEVASELRFPNEDAGEIRDRQMQALEDLNIQPNRIGKRYFNREQEYQGQNSWNRCFLLFHQLSNLLQHLIGQVNMMITYTFQRTKAMRHNQEIRISFLVFNPIRKVITGFQVQTRKRLIQH